MPQLNIYVPEKVEKVIRQKAKDRKLSLSAYVTDILKKEVPSDDWGDFFERIAGGLSDDFPDKIDRPPPEDFEL